MRATVWLLALLPVAAAASDDLTPLSDEFNNAATLSQWQRVYQVEGWSANQLEKQDIDTTRPGHMYMMPFTSTWFNDYRGELTFKTVQGDFVVTTDVEAISRSGSGAPRAQYSLAGIMVRAPRNITPQTWRPGGENYMFLSIGSGDRPGTFQFEVKTTTASNSVLVLSDATTTNGHALIQVARLGPFFIMLKNVNGVWSVHRRYTRTDMPPTLQVGMTVYTDYPDASMLPPAVHNNTVIHSGFPDLVAAFDYFRFQRPNVPPALAFADFSNPFYVSDADLLSFLGANANTPPAPAPATPARHRAVHP